MTEVTNHLYDTIDEQNSGLPASTRRGLVKTTAAALGSMGMLGLVADNAFGQVKTADENSVANITTVAATAEVLATIVNTVGAEKLAGQLDATTLRNVRAAAQQEKNHYELLTSSAVGGKAATTSIHVPDEVFSSPTALLTTLAVGDQVFINAYLLANTVFARQGTLKGSKFARYTAEIMAVEAVHRALALQSLGKLGNDRAYAKFAPARGRQRPADHGRARLLQDHGRGRDPRVRGLRLRQGRQQAGPDLRVRHRGRAHAHRPGREHARDQLKDPRIQGWKARCDQPPSVAWSQRALSSSTTSWPPRSTPAMPTPPSRSTSATPG